MWSSSTKHKNVVIIVILGAVYFDFCSTPFWIFFVFPDSVLDDSYRVSDIFPFSSHGYLQDLGSPTFFQTRGFRF